MRVGAENRFSFGGSRKKLAVSLAVVIFGMTICGEVSANEVTNVDLWVRFESDSTPQNEISACRCKYWAKMEWSAGTGDPELEDNDFQIEIWDTGEPTGPEDDDYYPPSGIRIAHDWVGPTVHEKQFEITNAFALTVGTHHIRAWAHRDDTVSPNKWEWSSSCTVHVVEVDYVDESATEICICESSTFAAYPDPANKPYHCLEWQTSRRDNPSSSWSSWASPGADWEEQGTLILTTCTAGQYRARARNGACDSWQYSEIVTVVKVGQIQMYAGAPRSWHNVTGSSIVALKGSAYNFKALTEPSGFSWPCDPVWYLNGSPIETGEIAHDVPFVLEGHWATVHAQVCPSRGKDVYIYPIIPEVDSVEYGGGNHPIHNVSVPEYKRTIFQNEPGCWTKGSTAQAKVKFWCAQNLTFAEPGVVVRGETSGDGWNIGDWGTSASGTFGALWPSPAAGITCVAEWNIDPTVQYQDYSAQWRYKCTNGTDIWVNSTEQNDCRLYVVLGTPSAPQASPWKDVLDEACEIASGANNPKYAMSLIWTKFYYYAGGIYDTVAGASYYAWQSIPHGYFDLTLWLNNYPSVGKVNCHDMGQAEVIFANALGCGASWTYVGPFGYLNCIKPIGCNWTNNPFYDHVDYDDNPIVNGDAADDGIPNNHAGRSSFDNHSFARCNNEIYDASAGRVDVDSNPDEYPCQQWLLDGDDTWSSLYKQRVIDDVPSVATGIPVNPSFDVE